MKNRIFILGVTIILVFAAALPAQEPPAAERDRPFTVKVDTVWDMFFSRSFSGDYATVDPAIQGSPYKYQGEGDIRAFKLSAFDDPLNGRVKIAYDGDRIGANLELRVAADIGFTDAWDWGAWARPLKLLKIAAGNTAQRGGVERYQRFDDFLKTKISYFGIMYPTWAMNGASVYGNNFDTTGFPYGYGNPKDEFGYANFSGTDTDDLFIPAGSTERTTGFLLEADLGQLDLPAYVPPLVFSFSAAGLLDNLSRPYKDAWEQPAGTGLIDYDKDHDPMFKSTTVFGARIEWPDLLDVLTMSAVFKYSATSLQKTTAEEEINILNDKVGNYAFGFYANWKTPLKGLDITAGYSGLIQTWENPEYQKTELPANPAVEDAHDLSIYKKVQFPYYNGVDLRVSYTGVPRLTLTLSNNISIANIRGNDQYRVNYAKGWAYESMLNDPNDPNQLETPYRVEYYFGFYNALAVKYQFSNGLSVDVQAANRLGTFILAWQKDPVQSSTDSLGIYAGGSYTFVERKYIRATIRTGLAVRINNYSYQDTTANRNIHKAGYMDIGIPIGMLIEL